MLIYGFDCQKEILYLADFIQGRYQFVTCSFDGFRDSYEKIHHENDLVWDTFRLWRIEEEKFFYKESISTFSGFNLEYLIRLIEDYYSDFNSYKHFGWMPSSVDDDIKNRKYGIECYNELMDYLSEYKSESDYKDIYMIPFYLFYAQKRMMELRLNYINENICMIPQPLYDDLRDLRDFGKKIVMKTLNIKVIEGRGVVNKYIDEAVEILCILKQKDYCWGMQFLELLKTFSDKEK